MIFLKKVRFTIAGLPITHSFPKNNALLAQLISSADYLCGFAATLAPFAQSKKKIHILTVPLEDSVIRLLSSIPEKTHVLFLATGDPLFFGLAASLLRIIPKDMLTIIPNISIVQILCAKIGLPWHDTVCISLHGRREKLPLCQAMLTQKPVCILVDQKTSPNTLQHFLFEKNYPCTMHILRNAGSTNETLTCVRIPAFSEKTVLCDIPEDTEGTQTTILLIPEKKALQAHFGIEDNFFLEKKQYCTHHAVRALILSHLSFAKNDIFWDIGSGSGAISLEATRLVPEGSIYAIEKDAKRYQNIVSSLRTFGAYTVTAIHGIAPHCLSNLPRPTKIVLGGGLSADPKNTLLDAITQMLLPQGRIVISCVLLASVTKCIRYFSQKKWHFDLELVQISQAKALAKDLHFVAKNPVHVFVAQKPHKDPLA